MYDTILVPTDGSATSDRALDEAIGIAKLHGSALHVLSVVDDHVSPLGGYSQQVFESLRADAKRSVAEAVKHAQDEGVDSAVGEVHRGTPFEVILEYIDDEGIDLVVMGTHGRRGIERYVLGSVTERVLRLSPVPVLTVRAIQVAETAE